MNAKRSRSSRIFIIRKEGTKEPKSWSQHLDSLKNLVLPCTSWRQMMSFVIFQESLRSLSLSSLFICEERTDPKRPLVFQANIADFHQGNGHMYPQLAITLWFLRLVLEEYSVSNGNVWTLEERLVVDRRWELRERAKVWIARILQLDPLLANPRTWAHL